MAVRILHCHSTFSLGGKEARAVRLMNAFGDAAEHIRADAGWVRAVSDYAAQADRPVRVVTVTNATSAGG